MTTIRISDPKPIGKGTIIGSITVTFAELGVFIVGVLIHERNGSRWVQLPSMPVLDGGRRQRSDENGKLIYAPIFDFASKGNREAFSSAVIAAVERDTDLFSEEASHEG